MAAGAPRERRTFYLETADLIARLAKFVRERESITIWGYSSPGMIAGWVLTTTEKSISCIFAYYL